MSDAKCPLGEDCDLTIAYMMGAEKAKDTIVVLRRDNERLRAEAKTRTLDYLGHVGQLSDEIERLRAALKDARVSVEGWADYASDYIKEKWDLKGDLARIDSALKEKSDE